MCYRVAGNLCYIISHLPLYCFSTAMVRNYKKKTSDDKKYTKADLELAINEAKRTTIYRASKMYAIPYVTLHSRIKGIRGAKKEEKGRPITIPIEDETRLANCLKIAEKWGYGFSRKEVIELVARFIKDNNIKNNFKNGVPGEDWFLKFKKRHNLSLKTPQNVEYARKKALDPFIIYKYFDLLKLILDEHELYDKPERIWNLDESSLSIDPRKVKVVGAVNKASSRTISSPGKENTTILLMCNAAGDKAPPLIIYKGKNVWDQWLAPPEHEFKGTVYAASKKGWMEGDIFKNYFLKTVVPTVGSERPVLIIYDGHSTHVTIETLEAAAREQIIILKLPPHSSHLLQPLDLAVFKSFKCKWDEKLVTWQRNHIGQKLPKKVFSQFLCDTWKSISPDVISNGFRKGGIFPFNQNIISEESFPSDLMQRWKEGNNISTKVQEQREVAESSLPGPSSSCQPSNINVSFEDLLLSAVKQTPKPLPQKKTKICPGAEILTSTQAIDMLKEKLKPVKRSAKRKTRLPSNSSTSNSDGGRMSPVFIESDNSEEFVTEMLDNYIDESNIDVQGLQNIVAPGCWVLVKYSTKKLIKHFLGNVIEQNDGGWVVKFTRQYKNKFLWPKIEDTDTVDETDIIKVLPQPTTDRRGLLNFPVCFAGYNL